MHQARFERECERAAMLRKRIGTYWPTASDEYAKTVEAEWLRIDQVTELPHSEYEIVNGRIAPISYAWRTVQRDPERSVQIDPEAFS